ncbi:MAG: TusE/DsrC/DsvC family sulfur relay protein [Ferrovum sp.]|nr:TusE/DsrC/DsvC family sulfur relay protein [Ferrovum sp.]NDU88022.1 TusE/DsrC/DsvC family sulfur relay protein [Ferrovum sp.]
MSYELDGVTLETDDDGYLIEADYRDEMATLIAQSEGIALTPTHWQVIQYLREVFREEGKTPNFRNMLKDIQGFIPEADSKFLYDLFPVGPAKQAVKIAGLPKPFGKGGY